MQDAHHRAEFRIARLAKRLVQARAIEISRLRDLCHAASPCHHPKRVPHESRVAGFERRRDIGSLSLHGVEIFGGVKPGRGNHHCLSDISRAMTCARLMSRAWVRLSPPHSRITMAAPRG